MAYNDRFNSKYFFYTDKQKEILGRVFRYHRKNDCITPWEYLRVNKVCAPSTYKSVEKGVAKINYELYDNLMDLYGLEFLDNSKLENWIDDFVSRLYDACTTMDKARIELLANEKEEKLLPYAKYVMFKEYYLAISLVLEHYNEDNYLNVNQIMHALDLVEIFEDGLKILLLEVMAISNNNSVFDYKLEIKIQDLIRVNKSNPIISFYHASNLATKQFQGDEALKIHDGLIKYWSNEKNEYRVCKSLMGKLMIYRNLDKHKAEEIIHVISTKINHLKSNKDFTNNVNYNIGVFFYTIGKFDDAIIHFRKTLENDLILPALFMLCLSCTYVDAKLPAELDNYDSDDTALCCYLEYFRKKKSEVNAIELENYIMSNMLPYLKKEEYEFPIWSFFEREILTLNQITRNYSKHRKYLAEMKKLELLYV